MTYDASKFGEPLVEAGLSKNESYSAIQSMVSAAIQSNVRAGIDMDCDNDGAYDKEDYVYVQDLYPKIAVYSMNGKLFSVDYSVDKKNKVTLGDPKQVVTTYAAVESKRTRLLVAGVNAFEEAAYDSSTGTLAITVIKPGFNVGKGRYYPASTLKRDYKVFEGAKMFANHQTDSEQKSQPEGDVNKWVASVTKVYAESDGTIKAKAAVIDPPFKEKLDLLSKQGLLPEMGVSIRAVGEASQKEVEGHKTNYVESLLKARSVDFVTYAGAGGKVDAIESASNDGMDVDLMTEAQLRERRPDLVKLIESNHQEDATLKTLEQQLTEATAALEAEKTKNTTMAGQLAESDKKAKQAVVAAELTKQLSESKLPEVAKTRLTKQFAEAVEVTGIKEAIEAEQAYITSLGAPKKKMGVEENGDDANEPTAADKAKMQESLVESYKGLGLTEAEAKIAAKA